MSRKKIPNILLGIAVLVLVALIGIVTLLASWLVNNTVDEQFRSQELQLVTSLSQHAEATFNLLVADITSLSLQPAIKSATARDQADGLALMETQAAQYPGVMRAIARYDYRGEPRYVWPPDLAEALAAGEDLPFALPQRVLDLTESGDEVPLDVQLVLVPCRDDPSGTHLLIAPVYTPLRRTEVIVFELDLAALFERVMAFVEVDRREQLWVVSDTNTPLYQATDNIDYQTLSEQVPLATLLSYREPVLETYRVSGNSRLAAVAPIRSWGKSFVVVLSRDVSAAQSNVDTELSGMFALAVLTVLLLAVVMGWQLRRLTQEAQRSQQEAQRRRTARTLLEISRALNSTLDLGDVLRSIMAELSNIVVYDSAAILLLDRAKLSIAAHRSADAATPQPVTLPLDETQAAMRVIHTGRPLIIRDTRQDERWTPTTSQSEIRSWMGIPLRVRHKTVGVLNINSHEVGQFSAEEIELAEAFADQASVALQNARLHEMEVRQFDQELAIARDIQTSLLPSAAPDIAQLDIVAYTLPARQVSGDYYQYLALPDGRIGIAVGDVSGKGIPAAILMAVITTAMRDEVTRCASPADLLAALNQRLVERTRSAHVNSALLIGIFDPRTRRLELANGGMVQPYVRSTNGWTCVPVGGFPLGITRSASYTAKTITLAPGAMMVIMSDGFVEAQDADGEIFGFERLEKLLGDLPRTVTAQGVIDRVLAATRQHIGDEDIQDDLTLLVLHSVEITGKAAGEAAATGVVQASIRETRPTKLDIMPSDITPAQAPAAPLPDSPPRTGNRSTDELADNPAGEPADEPAGESAADPEQAAITPQTAKSEVESGQVDQPPTQAPTAQSPPTQLPPTGSQGAKTVDGG
ncbi:MAG: PP2C family protein-serine/threonine phosphatase [Anaerolineae bacterium]|nr:PP2C family protein-serine/threonine phosphatase [Anaerolineae bacterium]